MAVNKPAYEFDCFESLEAFNTCEPKQQKKAGKNK